MFLNRLNRSKRSNNPGLRSEDGSTIIGVVGLVAIAGILVAVITASTVQALGQTSSTRAGVQAQAAADAGVEFARALIASGACQTEIDRDYGDIYSSAELATLGVTATDPYFETTVQSRQVQASGGTWANGCPPSQFVSPGVNYELRIEATGHASSPGVAGASALDQQTVEAGFGWNLPTSTSNPSDASGGAIYIGGTANVNAFSVAAAEGVMGDIRMIDGDFGCTSGGVIEGNVLVGDGNASITNTCEITGSLLVSGSVHISSNVKVHGDVLAAGGGVELTNTTITVGGNVYANGPAIIHGQVTGDVRATGSAVTNGGSIIGGDLAAGGQVEVRGKVTGNVTTPSTAPFKINPDSAHVAGNVIVGGSIDTWGDVWNEPSSTATPDERKAYSLKKRNVVKGTIQYLAPVAQVPAPQGAPVVPPWVDFIYDTADWSDYLIVPWSGDCQVGSWNSASHASFNQIKNSTIPILVDARSCSNVTLTAADLRVKTDVVIINKSFTLGNGSDVLSADGQDHKVWFLTPDGNASMAGPQCSGGAGNFSTDGGPIVDDHIAAFVYTPCTISLNNGTQWRGQLYSQGLAVSSGDALRYVQIGIPGLDLDTGVSLPGGGTQPPLGTLAGQNYYRDLAGPTVG